MTTANMTRENIKNARCVGRVAPEINRYARLPNKAATTAHFFMGHRSATLSQQAKPSQAVH